MASRKVRSVLVAILAAAAPALGDHCRFDDIEISGGTWTIPSRCTELNFGNNIIGDEEAAALAEALKVNTALIGLALPNNGIGDDGAAALAEALKVNTALLYLNLVENYIGVDGAAALAEALEVNAVLTDLTLFDSTYYDGYLQNGYFTGGDDALHASLLSLITSLQENTAGITCMEVGQILNKDSGTCAPCPLETPYLFGRECVDACTLEKPYVAGNVCVAICPADSTPENSVCVSKAGAHCAGRGTLQEGSCVCYERFAGPQCEYSDAENCLGRGYVQDDGTCDCDELSTGPRCQYSDENTCSGNGVPDSSGVCTCQEVRDEARGIYETFESDGNKQCALKKVCQLKCTVLEASISSAEGKSQDRALKEVLPAAATTTLVGVAGAYLAHRCYGHGEVTRKIHFFAWFGVGLRLFDIISDYGFYFISLRGEAFESRYMHEGTEIDGKLDKKVGRAENEGRYNGAVAAIQQAALISCAVGSWLALQDIRSSWLRVSGASGAPTGAAAFASAVLVLFFEDVPQVVINVIYIRTMAPFGGADAISIISLVTTVLAVLVNIGMAWAGYRKEEQKIVLG